MRVLLVEDNPRLGNGLCKGLRRSAHTVDWLTAGAEARVALEADHFDVVILALGLSGSSALAVLEHWRQTERYTPVLALDAQNMNRSCSTTLDRGADDYVSRPVALEEIEARLRALMRRSIGSTRGHLLCGAVCLDQRSHTASVEGLPVKLTLYQYLVLEAPLMRPEGVIHRQALESRLYGWGDGPESNSLEVLVHKLRGKIGASRIQTVRGQGYRIVA